MMIDDLRDTPTPTANGQRKIREAAMLTVAEGPWRGDMALDGRHDGGRRLRSGPRVLSRLPKTQVTQVCRPTSLTGYTCLTKVHPRMLA